VRITDNAAYTAGAIYLSSSAVALITNSEILGNWADTEGGAIYVNSTGVLNLKGSTIANNTAEGSGTIYFSGATNTTVIENNLFENNSAAAGGAIAGELPVSRMEVRNNLFSGNHAVTARGGAVYFSAHTIPTLIILENNTFYNNTALWDGGGASLNMGPNYYLINNTFSHNMAATGGNLYLDHGASVSRMYNNISANHAGGGDCIAFYNSYINGSNNLIEDGGTECHPTLTGDPGLLPLADNGGPTQTMALPSDSPYVDAGNNAFCTSTDQRGTLRPQGTACDLGAVEWDGTAPTVVSSEPGDGDVFIAAALTTLQVTFSEPMNQYAEDGRVEDPSNYLLINDKDNGFQTTSCVSGASAQDQSFPITKISYNTASQTSSLEVNNGNVLPVGKYRLFICGTSPALEDVAGNSLNNGSSDTFISFRVIAISGNSVPENRPAGTVVFELTAPSGNNFSYGLDANEPGCSGVDNSSFSFSSNRLVTTAELNYEAKSQHTVCVTFSESGGSLFHQQLVLYVTNVNEPPSAVGLSNATVNENSPAATLVGFLSTQDPDANATFTYSLVEGVAGCDSQGNGSFTITGNVLRTNTVFDYETKSSYSICVHSVDQGGLSIDNQLTITVLNTNDAPSQIILTPSSIQETLPGNTIVGYLIAIDPDGPSTSTFSIIPGKIGCSATGFNWFVLANGNEIRTLAPLDYGMANSYTLCVRATDSLGAAFEGEVTITVINTTPPRVLSVRRVGPASTAASSVSFTLTFSEPVTGVNTTTPFADFALVTTGVTGAGITGVSGSGAVYTIAVNTGSGNGTIHLDVVDDDSIRDAGNYPLGGSGAGNGDFTSGETYTILKPASIDVTIGGSLQESYTLGPSQSARDSYAGVNSGPVKIANMHGIPLIGAERVIYKVNGVNTSFSEMMGLPAGQLDNTYWLPWYNNVDLDTQLRIANVSGSVASVNVTIGGTLMTGSPFNLAAGASTRLSFSGVNGGPVQIVSSQAIVVAERVIYKVGGVNTSFTEMMALPDSQLATTYWLPWYNNKDLDTQLRIANATQLPASVHVSIGGVEMTGSPFVLEA
ncbi:MAG TPA: choice-of-anchor Q domain-containing protein, partial [Anaerolineales bacterium]